MTITRFAPSPTGYIHVGNLLRFSHRNRSLETEWCPEI